MGDTIRRNNKHKFKRYSVYFFVTVWVNRITCWSKRRRNIVNIVFFLHCSTCCGLFDTVRLYSITNIHTQRKIKGESGCFGTYSRAFFTSINLYYVIFNVKKVIVQEIIFWTSLYYAGFVVIVALIKWEVVQNFLRWNSSL